MINAYMKFPKKDDWYSIYCWKYLRPGTDNGVTKSPTRRRKSAIVISRNVRYDRLCNALFELIDYRSSV